MKRAALLFCSLFFAAFTAGAQTLNLKAPIAEKPAVLTTSGQSADIEMIKVLLDRAKLPYKLDAKIAASALAATGGKSLILVLGGSSKGLGAAGISAQAEIDRTKALMAEAKQQGMKIIGLHIGGEGRRGELSDKFLVDTVPACDYVIVVADGNKDGLFTKLAGSKVPLDTVEKITKVSDPLVKAFK
jgi:hypothetical protein